MPAAFAAIRKRQSIYLALSFAISKAFIGSSRR
uniref:Uncharacterized protein n=1 Tax=Siphoviridae sp. cty1O100 TaxID=2825743 RepID=A0A8S5Q3N0_9CAUD|nr:MAG TPA: hypothetical protein [Siphoviridae sp. cty1O100]DAM24838.1 MAG TPA: hypothetical protein [Caudoviricetes sp.]DAN86398.1 MAG TPA: hypothetical protein [Bacteriophage sp.]